CFLACQTGFICAWPSYTTAVFKSNETVLSAPMTSLQISLLGSLPNVGGLIITLLPQIAWTIISLTSNVTLVLLAIAFAGVGIAGQNVSLIYISEIAHDSIRGGLTACSASGYFLGLLISHILGGHLSYTQVVYTHLTLSVLAIGLLMLLKESPVYLVLVGKEKEVEAEISKIKLQLDPRLEIMLEASNVLQVYAEPLFIEAVPSMPSNQCAILVALDFLIASIVCVLVVDRCGRKFHWAPAWVTALLIYVYSFVYTTGCATIPFVRGLCNSITMAFVWIFNFITLLVFNPLVDRVGLGPVFYLFSFICFAGSVYSHFCVPETKGLSVFSPEQVVYLNNKPAALRF
ncbi:Sugar transporter, partial [Operophtera brumata]